MMLRPFETDLALTLPFMEVPGAFLETVPYLHEITHMCQGWKPGISICWVRNT